MAAATLFTGAAPASRPALVKLLERKVQEVQALLGAVGEAPPGVCSGLLEGCDRRAAYRRRKRQGRARAAAALPGPAASGVCPITLQEIEDPVVGTDCVVYERAALECWARTHDTSPLTRAPLRRVYLEPVALRRLLATSGELLDGRAEAAALAG
jgi:hypothetical protein